MNGIWVAAFHFVDGVHIHTNNNACNVGLQKSPSQGVSIRAISPEKYTVIDQATNEVIEEVEENKAFFEVLVCEQSKVCCLSA